MKIKDYLKKFNQLVEEHPEVLEMEAYSASDDEGNDYNIVIYTPEIVRVFKNEIGTRYLENGIVAEEDASEYPDELGWVVIIN